MSENDPDKNVANGLPENFGPAKYSRDLENIWISISSFDQKLEEIQNSLGSLHRKVNRLEASNSNNNMSTTRNNQSSQVSKTYKNKDESNNPSSSRANDEVSVCLSCGISGHWKHQCSINNPD